jgi:cation transport ATPase
MKQTKKQSAIETTVNIVVGIITSFLIQLWIYPLLNIPVTFQQNLIITAVFIVASFVRGYAIRRVFNNFARKN